MKKTILLLIASLLFISGFAQIANQIEIGANYASKNLNLFAEAKGNYRKIGGFAQYNGQNQISTGSFGYGTKYFSFGPCVNMVHDKAYEELNSPFFGGLMFFQTNTERFITLSGLISFTQRWGEKNIIKQTNKTCFKFESDFTIYERKKISYGLNCSYENIRGLTLREKWIHYVFSLPLEITEIANIDRGTLDIFLKLRKDKIILQPSVGLNIQHVAGYGYYENFEKGLIFKLMVKRIF